MGLEEASPAADDAVADVVEKGHHRYPMGRLVDLQLALILNHTNQNQGLHTKASQEAIYTTLVADVRGVHLRTSKGTTAGTINSPLLTDAFKRQLFPWYHIPGSPCIFRLPLAQEFR